MDGRKSYVGVALGVHPAAVSTPWRSSWPPRAVDTEYQGLGHSKGLDFAHQKPKSEDGENATDEAATNVFEVDLLGELSDLDGDMWVRAAIFFTATNLGVCLVDLGRETLNVLQSSVNFFADYLGSVGLDVLEQDIERFNGSRERVEDAIYFVDFVLELFSFLGEEMGAKLQKGLKLDVAHSNEF